MSVGRPSVYTDELASEICSRIAAGESLRSICRGDEMPVMSTVMLWLVDGKHSHFSEQYATARQIQAETLADEIFDIADDASNDWMERHGKDGDAGYQINGEHVQRSRLRVDTRKWYLSKVLPRFADKQQIEHSGGIDLNKMSDEDIERRIAELMNAAPKPE